MTIGFTQKHIEELPIDDLTAEQFLSIAIETCKLMGWSLSNVNETGFIAYTNNGIFTWNAEIRLKITNTVANLRSQSRGNEIIEFGKNKANLQSFISAFYDLKKSLTPEELTIKYKNLQLKFA
ncbi:MAG: hypothetical protein ABI416_18195 [Ginsengibacter sp.]